MNKLLIKYFLATNTTKNVAKISIRCYECGSIWNNQESIKIRETDNGKNYQYDISKENWHGPRNVIEQLPTTSQWSNVHLSNTERKIVNEYNKLVLKIIILFPKYLVILTMKNWYFI